MLPRRTAWDLRAKRVEDPRCGAICAELGRMHFPEGESAFVHPHRIWHPTLAEFAAGSSATRNEIVEWALGYCAATFQQNPKAETVYNLLIESAQRERDYRRTETSFSGPQKPRYRDFCPFVSASHPFAYEVGIKFLELYRALGGKKVTIVVIGDKRAAGGYVSPFLSLPVCLLGLQNCGVPGGPLVYAVKERPPPSEIPVYCNVVDPMRPLLPGTRPAQVWRKVLRHCKAVRKGEQWCATDAVCAAQAFSGKLGCGTQLDPNCLELLKHRHLAELLVSPATTPEGLGIRALFALVR